MLKLFISTSGMPLCSACRAMMSRNVRPSLTISSDLACCRPMLVPEPAIELDQHCARQCRLTGGIVPGVQRVGVRQIGHRADAVFGYQPGFTGGQLFIIMAEGGDRHLRQPFCGHEGGKWCKALLHLLLRRARRSAGGAG